MKLNTLSRSLNWAFILSAIAITAATLFPLQAYASEQEGVDSASPTAESSIIEPSSKPSVQTEVTPLDNQSGESDSTDVTSNEDASTESTEPEDPAPLPEISGRDHVENIGWKDQGPIKEEDEVLQLGTEGQGLRLEAIELTVEAPDGVTGTIIYNVHGENYGWQADPNDQTKWAESGESAGSEGQSQRIEAVQISLTEQLAELYDILYRAHVQNIGWLEWACNGALAGTSGQSLRLEAIQIKFLVKGTTLPDSDGSFRGNIAYTSHVQNIGWQGNVYDGGMSGTSGAALRLEAITITIADKAVYPDLGVEYRTHVQNIGWQDWVSDGAISGTVGNGYRIEAIEIVLTGTQASNYNIFYRVHAANIGWMGWAKNGETAGTSSAGIRLEAIEIILRKIAKEAPTPDGTPAYLTPSMVSVKGEGFSTGANDWIAITDDGVIGTTGKNLPLLGIAIEIVSDFTGSVSYDTHLANVGWIAWETDGAHSGTLESDNQIQAVMIGFSDQLASYFDVYYRSHVAGYGWEGWALNGAASGTTGLSKNTEAIQIFVTVRGGTAPGSTAFSFSDENGFFNVLCLNVPCTWNQYAVGLPTGCESMALTHLLQYWGFGLAPNTIADGYMPWSSTDFVYSFLGNPHTYSGWAIMAPGITNTANSFLASNGSTLRAYDITGTTLAGLLDYILNQKPMVVWTTVHQQDPSPVASSMGYTMYSGTHAVVLDGYNKLNGTVHLSDSINGSIWVDLARFEYIYNWMGMQAVVIC